MIIRYGTRGSTLALTQARKAIAGLLKINPRVSFEETIIKTLGDLNKDMPLFQIGGQGLFIKQIEDSLLKDKIDIAIHSLKDVPYKVSEGLTLFAFGNAQDPRDCFVSNKYSSFNSLPPNSVIGTSSLRRRAQLLSKRRDIIFSDLRGNLDTRLKKMDEGELDAIIIASAGMFRLGFEDKIKHFFEVEEMVPAVGQGLLALQCRTEDQEKFVELFGEFTGEASALRAKCERAFLGALQGGCKTPAGAFCAVNKDNLVLTAFVGTLDGKKIITLSETNDLSMAEQLGTRVAQKLLDAGAKQLIDSSAFFVE